MKIILLLITTLIIGFGLSYLFFQKNTPISKVTFSTLTPTVVTYNFLPENPPPESLIGQISSPSGEIFWQSRLASESAILGNTAQIKQGEIILTKQNSQVNITFPIGVNIKIFSDSQIELVQTLPQNIVISQVVGLVSYSQSSTAPLSIRTLHLLVNLNNSDTIITTDIDKGLVYLDIYSGSVSLGYNDLDFQTTTINTDSGQRVVYDDTTRTLVYKKIPPKE